jgi:hypothetical protein
MTMHHGTNRILEEEADRIIKESLKGVTRYSDKADILTPWKQKSRARREILTSSGFPEPALRQGMFNRRHNPARPDLNSRDGIAQARGRGLERLQTFVAEYGAPPEE